MTGSAALSRSLFVLTLTAAPCRLFTTATSSLRAAGHAQAAVLPIASHIQNPSDVLIYVVSGDARPQGDCSAKTWVSDAISFGFRVIYYSTNSSHFARDGSTIPTRHVEDYGALAGVRDQKQVWSLFAANILEDVLQESPDVKAVMRMDDDSFLNPYNFWRSLLTLPTKDQLWMLGDCGNDEHHSEWCSGGAGILLSQSLARELVGQLRGGYQSRDVCAFMGRNDDDSIGICAEALFAKVINHHGFHPFPPVELKLLDSATNSRPAIHLPWYTYWPRVSWLLGDGARLDGCSAQKMGSFSVVQDWITYHHMTCEQQYALGEARHAADEPLRPGGDEALNPPCASAIPGGRFESKKVEDRCRDASTLTQGVLCRF